MADRQMIYAQHDNKCMNSDPTSRTGIDKDTVNDCSHVRSMAVGTSSTSYMPSSYSSQMPILEHTASVRPINTHTSAQQAPPIQTKVTSTEQHWIIPDHYLRNDLLVPENFGHSPRFTSSLQSFANSQSPNQETRTPSRLIPCLGSSEGMPVHGIDFASSKDRETLPQEGQSAHQKARGIIPAQPSPSRWQQARDYRRKVYEPPYLNPHIDDSIAHVEANAEFWVDQLMVSITNTKGVKDTATSHHRRLFSSEGIDPLLIEACSREIFTALIDRCKNGFRGPPAFNKALKASHQLEPDRTATCEERIQNVIKVLLWNKRACKDVLYEDWKIKLLVNHPLSYDKEKDSQKGSNDQRRRRQLAAQEKMEKTEQALRAYREAHRETIGDSTNTAQCNDDGFAWEKNVPPEWIPHKADRGLKLEDIHSTTGKHPYEELGGSNAKRQRV
ncbi:hypothetical protein P171DRAFT_492934 [Karstenula rhodostoma CBS 690.94]|uniref:Uncharacterized protein n=1 Tax=Karstenula rhodostoma CBS 690.94 TaxID=1392251 RepID=A0A9P4PW30_9PLEO|nr:hypothetical protein P171DRAFT_492934 [Karstenula rhodostoma CBS 690.94]